MSETQLCHCGKPLHYTDSKLYLTVQKFVDDYGEFVPVNIRGKGIYSVPRHYIALHGVMAEKIDELGFKKIK